MVIIDSLTGPATTALLGSTAGLGMQYVMLSNLSATFIQFPLVSHFLRPQEEQHSSTRPNVGKEHWWQLLWKAIATAPIISAAIALCIGQIPCAKVSWKCCTRNPQIRHLCKMYGSVCSLGPIDCVIRTPSFLLMDHCGLWERLLRFLVI